MHTRFIYQKVQDNLTQKHITLIIGPRQVGKTTVILQLYNNLIKNSKKAFFLNIEDKDIKNAFNLHPEQLFNFIAPINPNEKYYIFIDEIQYLDDPSNFLKYLYDQYNENLKLIVSGSSSFYIDKKFKDSLAGRKRIFRLSTLSFKEFVYFKDREELVPYINTGNLPKLYKIELDKLMHEYLIYGSYPELILAPNLDDKKEILKEIATSYIKKDIVDSNIRSPELYYQILQLLASQTGSLFNINNLSKLLAKSNQTIDSYIYVMLKSFHISRISPFYSNLILPILVYETILPIISKLLLYEKTKVNYLRISYLNNSTTNTMN